MSPSASLEVSEKTVVLLPGLDPPSVQLHPSHYNTLAIPALLNILHPHLKFQIIIVIIIIRIMTTTTTTTTTVLRFFLVANSEEGKQKKRKRLDDVREESDVAR